MLFMNICTWPIENQRWRRRGRIGVSKHLAKRFYE